MRCLRVTPTGNASRLSLAPLVTHHYRSGNHHPLVLKPGRHDRDRNEGSFGLSRPPVVQLTIPLMYVYGSTTPAYVHVVTTLPSVLVVRSHNPYNVNATTTIRSLLPFIPWITSWSRISSLHDPVCSPWPLIPFRGDICPSPGWTGRRQACLIAASMLCSASARVYYYLLSMAINSAGNMPLEIISGKN